MYKIKFTEKEKNIFNTIDNDNKKKKLMSVYSYLLKHSIDDKLIISSAKLYAKYIRYHFDMSLTYFKKLINILSELDLIAIDKSKKVNSYTVRVAEKVTEKVTEPEVPESVDIPELPTIDEKRNSKSLNNNYTSTQYTQQEVVAPVELICEARKLFKEMKIRSKFVKEIVEKKLRTCFNVNRAGMVNYILKVILEKKSIQESRRSEFKKRLKINISSQDNFNSYDQRSYTSQQFEEMEWRLLGWS